MPSERPMRRRFCTLLFVVGLTIGSALAQQALPPRASPTAHIVRVRTGSYAGMCYGYCVREETAINPGAIVAVSRTFSQKRKYHDENGNRKITKQEWEGLLHSIDAPAHAAFNERSASHRTA